LSAESVTRALTYRHEARMQRLPWSRRLAITIFASLAVVGCSSTTTQASSAPPAGSPPASLTIAEPTAGPSYPPGWAEGVCEAYVDVVNPPLDVQDVADTRERTSDALDALHHVPDWPPGDPIRAALLDWTRRMAHAAEQQAAGDTLGSARSVTEALDSNKRAGALLDLLESATGAKLPC
jgi:hypothetical protein